MINDYQSMGIEYNIAPDGTTVNVGVYPIYTCSVLEGRHSVTRSKPLDLFRGGTPYTYVYESWSNDPLICVMSNEWGTSYRKSSSVIGCGSFGMMELPDVRTKLRLAIKDAGANLLQNLGEAREVIGLCKTAAQFALDCAKALRNPSKLLSDDPYVSVKRALRKFRALPPAAQKAAAAKARQYARRQRFKNAADAQLTWNFGIAPLLQDINDASARLGEKLGEEGYVEKKVSCSITKTSHSIIRGSYNSRFGRPFVENNQTVKVRAVALVRYSMSVSLAKEFGLTNPFAAAYELVPFSFVVDQLFSIGDTLSALDALTGTQSVAWYTTILQQEDSVSSVGGLYHFKQLSRSGVSDVLEFGHIEYKPSKSLMALANDLAVLTTLRSRG